MKNLRTIVLTSLMAAWTSAAMAQPGGGQGPGSGATSTATTGGSMKTDEDCKAHQDQHHEQMAARARERGGKVLAQLRRDACGGLMK